MAVELLIVSSRDCTVLLLAVGMRHADAAQGDHDADVSRTPQGESMFCSWCWEDILCSALLLCTSHDERPPPPQTGHSAGWAPLISRV
jgi:hypothetical protein